MQIARKLLDRIVFSATSQSIHPEDRVRHSVEFKFHGTTGKFELWGHDLRSESSANQSRWVILKFPGTGGRAERTTVHPAGFFPEGSVDGVWAVNPPGYGTSKGRPSLETMPVVICAAMDAVREISPGAKILVAGNSLGCVWALYGVANCGADGLLLRNPFSIGELISGRWRYNWWNAGTARYLARVISPELSAVRNAAKCQIPCLIVRSELDRLIPAKYQHRVIDSLAGPSRTLVIPGADHGDQMPESLLENYQAMFQELFADQL